VQREFEARLDEHLGIVLKLAGAYCPPGVERDDLVQEICLQLWRSYRSYDPSRRFSTWMYRVALNTAISFARRTRSREGRKVPLEKAPGEAMDRARSSGASPDGRHEDTRVEELHRFIRGLDEMNRSLVVLYLEDRSYAEIGEILGISATNVGTKLSRLKQRMRSELAPEDTDHTDDSQEAGHGAG
jgi:RNA polymerase sigma-70 factor (ECF subfamily)